jgi:imidazole glycerol-phosphate synthase subunit HisH
MHKVGILDYGLGNLLSLARAIEHIGAKPIMINNAEETLKVDSLILPGVGAFPDGMSMVNDKNFKEVIQEHVKKGKAFLGICLGMQMLLSKGHEHRITDGLDLIEGEVLPLPNEMHNFKIPNINWHEIESAGINQWNSTIFKNTPEGSHFYFVHSFYAKPSKAENILSTTKFGTLTFASAIVKDNIYGTQFHPEKSGNEGLRILESFIQI